MQALKALRIAHLLAAAFCGLSGIAGFIFSAWFCYQVGKEEGMEAAGWIMGLGAGLGALVLLLIACLFLFSAKKVAQGRGRILATLVSATLILGPGIFVFIATVWICWFHKEARGIFAAGGIDDS